MSSGLSYNFYTGCFRATYGGTSIGQTEDGFRFRYTLNGEPVIGAEMGQSVQDLIYQGGNCFIDFTLIEFAQNFSTLVSKLVWPWKASGNFGTVGQVGILANGVLADALVLTKITGTPAYFASITANEAILAPGYPVEMLLNPRLAKIPISLQLLPYGSQGSETWFVPATS